MKNQFFYTRREPIPPSETEETPVVSTLNFRDYRDSFNIDLVIRSRELEDGRLIVLLNDMHERPDNMPVTNSKGKITGTRVVKNVYQSEIFLELWDVERFYKATGV